MVISNSFGHEGSFYGSRARDIDITTWLAKDFLLVFGAGNAGGSANSISLESQSKNALVVGNSMISNSGWEYQTNFCAADGDETVVHSSTEHGNCLIFEDIRNSTKESPLTCGAMYIGHVTSPQWTLQACIVSSVNNISVENECSFPVHPSGSCAKACFISGSSKNDIRICRVCVSGGVPSPSQFLAVVFGGKDFPHSYYNQQNLASSSSKGPTVDGRIKPDLVAPGDNILFADSYPIEPRDQKCSSSDSPSQNIYGMSGTSMATPSVSGAAALVREWLQKYYPLAPPTVENVTPLSSISASLVRSFLIVSAQPLTGLTKIGSNWVPINNNPYWMGFGRVVLSQVIPTSNSMSRRSFALENEKFEFPAGSTASTFGSRQYTCIVNPSKQPSSTSVVLSWTDFPNAVNIVPFLFIDLDLRVLINRNKTLMYFGNQEFMSQGVSIPDRKNTIERIVVPPLSTPSRMDIIVEPSKTIYGGLFSLVVSGNVLCDSLGIEPVSAQDKVLDASSWIPISLPSPTTLWIMSCDFMLSKNAACDPGMTCEGSMTRAVACISPTPLSSPTDEFCSTSATQSRSSVLLHASKVLSNPSSVSYGTCFLQNADVKASTYSYQAFARYGTCQLQGQSCNRDIDCCGTSTVCSETRMCEENNWADSGSDTSRILAIVFGVIGGVLVVSIGIFALYKWYLSRSKAVSLKNSSVPMNSLPGTPPTSQSPTILSSKYLPSSTESTSYSRFL